MWYRKKPMWYRYFRCGIGIFPLRAFSDTTSEIISNRETADIVIISVHWMSKIIELTKKCPKSISSALAPATKILSQTPSTRSIINIVLADKVLSKKRTLKKKNHLNYFYVIKNLIIQTSLQTMGLCILCIGHPLIRKLDFRAGR
jgi:hypothetical protein